MTIRLKRAYEPPRAEDGARYLVDRLWPRGLRKEEVPVRAWLQEVAPSDELRTWFEHDRKKWDEFERRYRAELEDNVEALEPLLRAARQGTVTLVYAAADTERNNAVVLKGFLQERLEAPAEEEAPPADPEAPADEL